MIDEMPIMSGWVRFWRERGDLITTVLLAAATVLTAWAGFQAAKWSGLQAINFSEAGASRTESTRASDEAGQLSAIDVSTWLAWLEELQRVANEPRFASASVDPDVAAALTTQVTEGDSLAAFLFQRFRDEFRPAVIAWLETDPFASETAPPTPFVMADYRLEASDRAASLLSAAEASAAEARENNQQSDNYVLLTVMFATVLFFAGLSLKTKSELTQISMLTLGALVLIGAAIVLAQQPIEI